MSESSNEKTGFRVDGESLRILAHPLRSRLLASLRIDGPATATDLAVAMESNTGVTSYHLRKLESVGLIEDRGEGAGKRRLWRAATDSHQFTPGDFEGDATAEADLNWLRRHYSRGLAERYEAWLDVERSWPTEWRNIAGLDDDIVTVTAEQAEAMSAEIDVVVARYRVAGQGDPQARRLSISKVIYPLHLDQQPVADKP